MEGEKRKLFSEINNIQIGTAFKFLRISEYKSTIENEINTR